MALRSGCLTLGCIVCVCTSFQSGHIVRMQCTARFRKREQWTVDAVPELVYSPPPTSPPASPQV